MKTLFKKSTNTLKKAASRSVVNPLSFLLIHLIPAIASASDNSQISSITLPITIDLAALEQRINTELPVRLASIDENNQLCIPERKVRYKYPCVIHWRLRMCDGWTKGTPDVYCDINGYVDRQGLVSLNGDNESIAISLSVHASVTAKPEGIFSETAKANATFL